MRPEDFIEIKASGGQHTAAQFEWFVRSVASGEFAPEQIGAWLMAVRWHEMTAPETADYARALAGSGVSLRELFADLGEHIIEKHSIGGQGDNLTITFLPTIAAAGLPTVKFTSAALGPTGGTAYKLRSIPGFRLDLSPDELYSVAKRHGLAIGTQTSQIAPVDGALYKMRGRTATAAPLSLTAGSIMSKKGHATNAIFDMTFGCGAFMKTQEEAKTLASLMFEVGRSMNLTVSALLTNMNHPQGWVGNSLAVREAIEVLKGGKAGDLRQYTLEFVATMLVQVGMYSDQAAAITRVAEIIDSGAALQKFTALVESQGGDPHVVDNPDLLGVCHTLTCEAKRAGWVADINALAFGRGCLELGGGSWTKDALPDLVVGIVPHVHVGDQVVQGQPLFTVHHRGTGVERKVEADLEAAFAFSEEPITRPPLILARL